MNRRDFLRFMLAVPATYSLAKLVEPLPIVTVVSKKEPDSFLDHFQTDYPLMDVTITGSNVNQLDIFVQHVGLEYEEDYRNHYIGSLYGKGGILQHVPSPSYPFRLLLDDDGEGLKDRHPVMIVPRTYAPGRDNQLIMIIGKPHTLAAKRLV